MGALPEANLSGDGLSPGTVLLPAGSNVEASALAGDNQVSAETARQGEPPPTVTPAAAELAIASALLTRLVGILDAYSSGPVLVRVTPTFDAQYIDLRRKFLKILADAPECAGIDPDAFRQALPPSLGEYWEAAIAGTWSEYSEPEIYRLQGRLIASCLEAGGTPADLSTAEDVVGGLGWDRMIADFKSQKQQAIGPVLRRIGLSRDDRDRRSNQESPRTGAKKCNAATARRESRANRARAMRATGEPIKAIARDLGVSERSVHNYLSDQQ